MANTRSTALAPDLIQRYVTKHDERAEIVKTMTKISGFDQVIDDFCDDYVDKNGLSVNIHAMLKFYQILLNCYCSTLIISVLSIY